MSGTQHDAGDLSGRKLDDDDHDLLTFGEAGERLRQEIHAARVRVAEVQAPEELAAARARLAALEEAAQRNSAQPINDDNFKRFFGYPGKAKRNVPNAPGEC